MNHFIILHQIAVEQHNERLQAAAQARLVKAVSRHGWSEAVSSGKSQDTRRAWRELFLARKAATLLKWLVAALLLVVK